MSPVFNGAGNGATGEFLKLCADDEHAADAAPRPPRATRTLRFSPYMTLLAAHRCALSAGYAGITTEQIDGRLRVVPRVKIDEDEIPAFLRRQAE